MQSDSHIRLIYATFPDTDSHRAAGEALVRERLAACINMWPGMVSIYRWQGEIEEANEVVFLAKTTLSQSAAAISRMSVHRRIVFAGASVSRSCAMPPP